MKKKKVVKLKANYYPEVNYVSKNELLQKVFLQQDEGLLLDDANSENTRLIVNCINKLMKKNIQTKLKALNELYSHVENRDEATLVHLFPSFLSVYKNLIYYANSTVRESLNLCLKLFIQKIKTKIKKHLSTFLPHLFLSIFDFSKNVRQVSNEILEEIFPKKECTVDVKKNRQRVERIRLTHDCKLYLYIKKMNVNLFNICNCLKYIKNDLQECIIGNLKRGKGEIEEDIDGSICLNNAICFLPSLLYLIIKQVKISHKDSQQPNSDNGQRTNGIAPQNNEQIREDIKKEYQAYEHMYSFFFTHLLNIYRENKEDVRITRTLFVSVYNIIYLLKKHKINIGDLKQDESNMCINNFICSVISNKEEYIFKNINHLLLLFFFTENNKKLINENFLRNYLSLVKQNIIYKGDAFTCNISLFMFLFEKKNIMEFFFFFFFLFYFILLNNRKSAITIYYDSLLHLLDYLPINSLKKANPNLLVSEQHTDKKLTNSQSWEESLDEKEENKRTENGENENNTVGSSTGETHKLWTEEDCATVLFDNILLLPLEILFIQKNMPCHYFCFQNKTMLNNLSDEYYCQKKKKKKKNVKEVSKFDELKKKVLETNVDEKHVLSCYINFVQNSNWKKEVLEKTLELFSIYINSINEDLKNNNISPPTDMVETNVSNKTNTYLAVFQLCLTFFSKLKNFLFSNVEKNTEMEKMEQIKQIEQIGKIEQREQMEQIKQMENVRFCFLKNLQLIWANIFILINQGSYEYVEFVEHHFDLFKLIISQQYNQDDMWSYHHVFDICNKWLQMKEVQRKFFLQFLNVNLLQLLWFSNIKHKAFDELCNTFGKALFDKPIDTTNAEILMVTSIEIMKFMKRERLSILYLDQYILKIYQFYISHVCGDDRLLNEFHDAISCDQQKLIFEEHIYFDIFYIYKEKIIECHVFPHNSFCKLFLKTVTANDKFDSFIEKEQSEKWRNLFLFYLFLIYLNPNYNLESQYEKVFLKLDKKIITSFLLIFRKLYQYYVFETEKEKVTVIAYFEETELKCALQTKHYVEIEKNKEKGLKKNEQLSICLMLHRNNVLHSAFIFKFLLLYKMYRGITDILNFHTVADFSLFCFDKTEKEINAILNNTEIEEKGRQFFDFIYSEVENKALYLFLKTLYGIMDEKPKQLYLYLAIFNFINEKKTLENVAHIDTIDIVAVFKRFQNWKIFNVCKNILKKRFEGKKGNIKREENMEEEEKEEEEDDEEEEEEEEEENDTEEENEEIKEQKKMKELDILLTELKNGKLQNEFDLKLRMFLFKLCLVNINRKNVKQREMDEHEIREQAQKNDKDSITEMGQQEEKINHEQISENDTTKETENGVDTSYEFQKLLSTLKEQFPEHFHFYLSENFNGTMKNQLDYRNRIYHLIYVKKYTNTNFFIFKNVQRLFVKANISEQCYAPFFWGITYIQNDDFFTENAQTLDIPFSHYASLLCHHYTNIYCHYILKYEQSCMFRREGTHAGGGADNKRAGDTFAQLIDKHRGKKNEGQERTEEWEEEEDAEEEEEEEEEEDKEEKEKEKDEKKTEDRNEPILIRNNKKETNKYMQGKENEETEKEMVRNGDRPYEEHCWNVAKEKEKERNDELIKDTKYGIRFFKFINYLIQQNITAITYLTKKNVMRNIIKTLYYIIALSTISCDVNKKLKHICIQLIKIYFEWGVDYFYSIDKIYLFSLNLSISYYGAYFSREVFFTTKINSPKKLEKIKKKVKDVYINTYLLFILLCDIENFSVHNMVLDKTLCILKMNSLLFHDMQKLKENDEDSFRLVTDYLYIKENNKEQNEFLNSVTTNSKMYEESLLSKNESTQVVDTERKGMANLKKGEKEKEEEEEEEEDVYTSDDSMGTWEKDNKQMKREEITNDTFTETKEDGVAIEKYKKKGENKKDEIIVGKEESSFLFHLRCKLKNSFMLIDFDEYILNSYNFVLSSNYLEILLFILNICLSSDGFIYDKMMLKYFLSFWEIHHFNLYYFIEDIETVHHLLNKDEYLKEHKIEFYIFFFALHLCLRLITLYTVDAVKIINGNKFGHILSYNQRLFSNLFIHYQIKCLTSIADAYEHTVFSYDEYAKMLHFKYKVPEEDDKSVSDTVTAKLTIHFHPGYPFCHFTINDRFDHLDRKACIQSAIKAMYKFTRTGDINEIFITFNNIMNSYFENKSSCNICFMVLHQQKVCDKTCTNCEATYHSHCLHRWFLTSHNTKCPSCQVQFNT